MPVKQTRTLTSLLTVILVLLLSVTGMTVYAIGSIMQELQTIPSADDRSQAVPSADDRSQTVPSASDNQEQDSFPDVDQQENSTEQDTDNLFTADETFMAIQDINMQNNDNDVIISASPTQQTTADSPDVMASATINPSHTDQDSDDVKDDDEDRDDDDRDDDDRDDDSSDHVLSGQLLSMDQAKEIALARIDGEARILSIEFDNEEYPAVYEVQLTVDDQLISLTIHAVTGAVLEYEREKSETHDDDDEAFDD